VFAVNENHVQVCGIATREVFLGWLGNEFNRIQSNTVILGVCSDTLDFIRGGGDGDMPGPLDGERQCGASRSGFKRSALFANSFGEKTQHFIPNPITH
jgi:hypothetical protein